MERIATIKITKDRWRRLAEQHVGRTWPDGPPLTLWFGHGWQDGSGSRSAQVRATFSRGLIIFEAGVYVGPAAQRLDTMLDAVHAIVQDYELPDAAKIVEK